MSDYYREHPKVRPPGGRFKYAVSRWIASRQEPFVLKNCSGFTSVSQAYATQIVRRYSDLRIPPYVILPFPATVRILIELSRILP